jgi:hypothetical protein
MIERNMVLAIALGVLILMLVAASVSWPACCRCAYDAEKVLRCD